MIPQGLGTAGSPRPGPASRVPGPAADRGLGGRLCVVHVRRLCAPSPGQSDSKQRRDPASKPEPRLGGSESGGGRAPAGPAPARLELSDRDLREVSSHVESSRIRRAGPRAQAQAPAAPAGPGLGAPRGPARRRPAQAAAAAAPGRLTVTVLLRAWAVELERSRSASESRVNY
jgi:hypothetical protein